MEQGKKRRATLRSILSNIDETVAVRTVRSNIHTKGAPILNQTEISQVLYSLPYGLLFQYSTLLHKHSFIKGHRNASSESDKPTGYGKGTV
jgi:hypothetical protein